MKNAVKIIFLATMLISLAGCGEKKESPERTEQKSPPTVLDEFPAKLKLDAAPQNPLSIGEAKKTAKQGDKIAIKGEIGGRKVGTFNPDLAAFLIADPELVTNCRKKGDMDGCPTPWDYCCIPKEELIKAICLIQVKDPATGQIIKKSLKGWHDLKELSEVIIEGRVSPESSEDSLIIDAEGIFIVK